MIKNTFIVLFLFFSACQSAIAQGFDITVGAKQTQKYFPLLSGKQVAVVANHSSTVGNVHLVDTLLNSKINIKKIFCPEHGFRGNDDAGELIKNYVDTKSGLPVISLYGNSKKPSDEDLNGIEIVIFDMQDVGVRFYTYISTMHYVMEACAEHNIPLIILDRPNPNGFYIDGPILDTSCASFVGLHPVPIVHGMTIGEYAQMINGEGWLKGNVQCKLIVIPCKNYRHDMIYSPCVKPSPNLPNQTAILLYPSLGLFEGTVISVGRGTDFPFQVFGNPSLPNSGFCFTPTEKPDASKNPPCKDQKCFGIDLHDFNCNYFKDNRKINLEWLIFAYKMYPDKTKFFNSYFENLAGTKELRKQIEKGLDADSIRASWKPQLEKFKLVRSKYLLYPDVE